MTRSLPVTAPVTAVAAMIAGAAATAAGRAWRILPLFAGLAVAAVLPAGEAAGGYPAGAVDTEPSTEPRLPPAEALKLITVPEGFSVTLFAGEPDVAQPIAMAMDDRGRTWVAECYSYQGTKAWTSQVRDRILILEDRDGDGVHDRRTVFWDGARNLTGLQVGFGGVWICSTPEIQFIPDADGDDVPDGPPHTVLDGWNNGEITHCVVNGLQWGPDGWLYGQQGILGESRVGKPGTPDAERTAMNCGIWRYHPTRAVFEVVAHGTTNPWGLDWDDSGQGFFTNCVIGHLWHLIPGGHYQRMNGQDYVMRDDELLGACSDHLHWAGGKWQESRAGHAASDQLGGGHAHVGAMIYLGDNWPASYRGALFTANVHGKRLNQDRLERVGSGYVGRHGADFLRSADPWFRGISVMSGPDGGVLLSDWSDVGECHDYTDTVHRGSGRIYKVTHGQPVRPGPIDLGKLDDATLVALQLHPNDWYVRHARRLLQERAAAGRDLGAAHGALRGMLAGQSDSTRVLRALWALHASGGIDDAGLEPLLAHADEHVRAWAVRLLVDDRQKPSALVARLATLAVGEPSPLVRLFLAAALQRIPPEARWDLAAALLGHAEDAKDANLPLMVWYGIEPLLAVDGKRALGMVSKGKLPTVLRFAARRISSLGK